MDIATIIGLIGAFATVGFAIAQGGDGGLILFVDPPSILIVLVGSIFVALIKFGIRDFISAVVVAWRAFKSQSENMSDLINLSVELANLARREGVLALEERLESTENKIENRFLRQGIQFLVDNVDPRVIRQTLQKDLMQTLERHELGQKIFKSLGDVAPAMGMIGTLIGLVKMLAAMDDPKSIGPAMAIALLTTLYGAMLANMFALPIADKLTLRSEQERRTKLLLLDTIVAIQLEQHPRILEESLKPYLAPKERDQNPEEVQTS